MLAVTRTLGFSASLVCLGLSACSIGEIGPSQSVLPNQPSDGATDAENPNGMPSSACVPADANAVVTGAAVSPILTTADGNALLAAQPQVHFLSGQCPPSTATTVSLDRSQTHQSIAGFGAHLTDSSARLLSTYLRYIDSHRTVLTKLFDPNVGLGMNFLRIDIGGGGCCGNGLTNLDKYQDPNLTGFDLGGADAHYIYSVLGAIRSANPKVKLIAAPWSGPPWMKNNNNMVGGALNPNALDIMARYILLFVQGYQAAGNTFYAIAPQNEPETAGNANGLSFPSSYLSAADEAAFIKNNLGPLFAAQEPNIKILAYEGDWAGVAHPLTVLGDPDALPFVAGTALHCDSGDPNAQDALVAAYPDKEVWLTRCGRTKDTSFAQDLEWYGNNMLVGGLEHGARALMMFNVALDPNSGPNRISYCKKCRGMVTVDLSAPLASGLTLNVEYYALGHLSKYVKPGAQRILSTQVGGAALRQVALVNPDGSTVLLLVNSDDAARDLAVVDGEMTAEITLAPHALMTLQWPGASGP